MPTESLMNSYGLESLIKDFQDNLINSNIERQRELFIHNYNAIFELYRAGGGTYSATEETFALPSTDSLFFNVLRKEVTSINGSIVYNYTSVETQEPEITNYNFLEGDSSDSTIIDYSLSADEQEIITYARPIELQIDLDEPFATSQRDYVNSIPRRSLVFNIGSSLDSVTNEDEITEDITFGTEGALSVSSETITDVGGPTATGERTFEAFSRSGRSTTSTATITSGGGY